MPTLPISVIGASGTNTTKLPWFSLAITLTGMSWTTGPAVVTGIGVSDGLGGVISTVTRTGFDNRNANHTGTVQLVTPIRILTNAIGFVPAFGTQTLRFVPEPNRLLLLGAGVALLSIVGFLRR